MNSGELESALRKTNLWWRKPRGWELDDPDLRRASAAPFRYEPGVLGDLVPGALYMLRGPRRVGKSVAIKRAVSRLISDGVDQRRIIHASCEGWRDADLGRLVDYGRRIATRSVAGSRYWFLDEITAVKGDWPSRIKWLRDNDLFGEDCVVLTGSSARGLDEAVKALAGRRGAAVNSDLLLAPMGFGDFCRVLKLGLPETPPVRPGDFLRPEADAIADALLPWCNELIDAWETYLRVGGFPQAVADLLLHGAVGDAFVASLWDVVHGEAVRSADFAAGQTQTLLAQLAGSLASPLNVQRVARDVASSAPTIVRRLRELQDGFLLWPCHQMDADHLVPRLRARSKVYFTDPVLARMAHMRSPEAIDAPDLAKLSEQQIGLELLRAHERLEPGSYLRFEGVMYRRTARSEIDFVGPWMGGVPFESKYVEGAWRRDALSATVTYDGRAVLATRSVLDADGRTRAIPAPIVALMLNP